MPDRLPEYEVTLPSGSVVTTRLTPEDARRLGTRARPKQARAANKSRSVANKAA